MPVCGHCIAIGGHVNHRPIVLLVAKRKKTVLNNVDELNRDFLPRVEAALVLVEKARSDLTTCSDQVRDEIRAAGQKVINTAKKCVAKKLQQVEYIEQERMKTLDEQHNDLTDQMLAVKAVISFTDRLKKKAMRGKELNTLFRLVENRAAVLSSCSMPPQLKEHSTLMLKTQSKDAITKALESLTGEVIECKAWAEKCIVNGEPWIDEIPPSTVSMGGTAKVIIPETRDKFGVSLSTGGDIITSEWLSGPATPPVEIVDYDNGRFALTSTLLEEGDYVLAVIVNGVRMPQTISRRCEGPPPTTFDTDACQGWGHW